MTTAARPLSPKMFLHRSFSKSCAANIFGFLQGCKEFLTTGEIADQTSPIVAKMTAGLTDPKIALEEIQNAVHQHVMRKDLQLAEDRMNKQAHPRESKSSPVSAKIFDGKGNLVDSEGFRLGQDGQRWLDRHLIAESPDCYGELIHNFIMIKGKVLSERIDRTDAFARVYNTQRGHQVMKRSPQSGGSLHSKMRAVESKAHFSHG